MRAVEALEETVGYRFQNRKLLDRALTHRSWIVEQTGERRDNGDNEQLEFLGDSLLGFVVSEALYSAHPEQREGNLSQTKAQLVCATHLHACAVQLSLGDFLYLGRGEDRNGGRERKNFLADGLEAVIAAIFLDGGFEPAKTFILCHIVPDIVSSADRAESSLPLSFQDYKGTLQEQAQARGLATPRYAVIATSGPEHSKRFTVEARIGNQFTSRGEGSSKKEASQQAARTLLEELNRNGWTLLSANYSAAAE